MKEVVGSYDNFLQIWREQTDEDLHRDKGGFKHDHVHVKIEKDTDNQDHFLITIYRGRNNNELLGKRLIHQKEIGCTSDHLIQTYDDGSISLSNGFDFLEDQEEKPYQLLRCRYFSGFIEYPLAEDLDNVHRMGNLQLHDQGNMVQLDYAGVDYTIELTQLIFAHKIKLMKIAIYDLPIDKVEINSKAISYAWSSPDAKRLGINIRKLISGWTFIEEGFLSSNNMDLNN